MCRFVLHVIMSVALDWEIIENNPCKDIPLPKLKYKEGKAYSQNQIVTLFDRLRKKASPERRLLVELAIVSAARQGELVALEEKHLNPSNNTILIEQALVNVKGDGIVLKEKKEKEKE